MGNPASDLEKRLEERFGVLPNFFRLAPETPEIIEKLWGFTQAAYLDNPLPSIFKERLFVYLSRFCAVRYCIARHVGFLVGLGRPAGDETARPQSVAGVVKLLRRPFPRGPELQSCLSRCAACPAPIAEMPRADTQMEEAVFVLAGHVFLKTSDYLLCLDALVRLLGPARLQYLLLFLAFVRAAHYWTETHPEIAFEDDIDKLLATHEALADCILNDPEARRYVDGSGFHLYGGKIEAMTEVHNAHPDKNLYFTEQMVTGSVEGRPAVNVADPVRRLIVGATRNWSRNVLLWNLAADPNNQPHTDDGGCTMCQGAITIDGNTVTRNVAYYALAHASRLVRPGSVRIESSGPESLPNVAFVAPGGRKIGRAHV